MASKTISDLAHLQIPLEEIVKATVNFADENIIGKGGFGNVYKGKLMRSGNLINISARRLDRRHGQGDVEFWTEISVLSSLKHENIVSLVGFCDEKDEKIIINQYYPKGSLLMYLSDPTLTWKKRLNISFDVVSAINYIHHKLGKSYYIIHRNINSSTILLDAKWRPKLSGFEFSIKHSVVRMNQVFLCEAIGTLGYMDPAIEKNGGVTNKSDIYSFGVVLFEILCGRKANEYNRLLAPLAKFHYENETLQDIIHSDLWTQMDPETFKSFSETAYSCLVEERAQRPDATRILQKLGTTLKLIQERSSHLKFASSDDDEDDEDEDDDEDEEYEEHNEDDWISGYTEKDFEYLAKRGTSNPWKVKKLEHLRIGFRDIALATNSFSLNSLALSTNNTSTIFELGYGPVTRDNVFKGELECVDREYVSYVEEKNKDELPKRRYSVKIECIRNIKHLFDTTIEILNRCKHRNIESLLGYCDESPNMMILVYKYFSSDYLSNYLNNHKVTWEKRLKICIDVAHGLNYLHNGMGDQKTVIHGNINRDNIELGKNWEARIVGFGHSVFMPPNQDGVALHPSMIAGYKYYIDPEYAKTGMLKRESDVFSFGAVMFEILCAMSIEEVVANEGHKDKGLAQLARRWFDEGIIKRKVAPIIKGENGENKFVLNKGPNEDSLDAFINIAYQCVAEMQNQRPTMKVVIQELEKALSFQENNKDTFRMTLEDIKLATQNFSRANVIGGGGFGRVYKGEVEFGHGNGKYTIVAKQLDTSHGQGEQQYYNELQILNEYKHENIIGLVGYSNETKEKIIVYEHAPKGSLDKYLNDASLTWRNRVKICIDFATGLDFLHGGVHGQEVVIHRDIKTANILLFDDWKAKIGDFGLSIISTVNKEADYVFDHACGTKGYLDPLYLKSGFLTIESDIYSFGVVLFEILCGRSTFETRKHDGRFLPSFIKRKFEEGKQDEMVFESIKEEIKPKSLSTFQNIAYQCLDDDRENRPKAKEVLAQLKKALEFQEEDKA